MAATSCTLLQRRPGVDRLATPRRASSDHDCRSSNRDGHRSDYGRNAVCRQPSERDHDHSGDGHRGGHRHRMEMAMDKHLVGPPYRTSSRVRAKSGQGGFSFNAIIN